MCKYSVFPVRCIAAVLIFVLCGGLTAFPAKAGEEAAIRPSFHVTGLPLPRFVSLKSDLVNMRTGPDTRYPVKWVYTRAGLPVEILLEYGVWRKVRDPDGERGWIHSRLLSARRRVIVRAGAQVAGHEGPRADARVVVRFAPGVVADVESCSAGYCEIEAAGYRGWVERKFIWGIYESEKLD